MHLSSRPAVVPPAARPQQVWCADTGEALAELDSCLPLPAPGSEPQPAQHEQGGADGQLAEPAAAQGEEQAAGAEEEAGSPAAPRHPPHQYQRGWEGVAALACRGALLASGSSEGAVLERDFSRGGLPQLEGAEAWGGAAEAALAGKFWQRGSLGG